MYLCLNTPITFADDVDLTNDIVNYFIEQGFKVVVRDAYYRYITIDWSD